jgi:hypothetical protein
MFDVGQRVRVKNSPEDCYEYCSLENDVPMEDRVGCKGMCGKVIEVYEYPEDGEYECEVILDDYLHGECGYFFDNLEVEVIKELI